VQGTGSGSEDDASLQEIVVTGFRASLQAAQRAKRSASEVVEAITPEDLGKFTDNSIADELQRVPGVQIDRGTDGRSGDHVSIRGMARNSSPPRSTVGLPEVMASRSEGTA